MFSHEHPTVAAGGSFGFYRTGSKPSLIAGLTLGASFAAAGTVQLICTLLERLQAVLIAFSRISPQEE